jgi:hypothetical protein
MNDLDDTTRTIYRFQGILGAFCRQQEVPAVYPVISTTAQPHRTDIIFRRGESFTVPVTVQDDLDSPQPFDISNCILRFAVKLGSGAIPGSLAATIGLEGAHIVKRNTPDGGIEVTRPGQGNAKIEITMADTANHPLGTGYTWDLELIRILDPITTSGTINVRNLDSVVTGNGTNLRSASVGHILLAQDTHAIITEIISDEAMKTENLAWTTSRREAYSISRSESRIVASGRWICVSASTAH